jgi:hypothetical protein
MIDINLPEVEGVTTKSPDGLYEKTGHGIDGKIQIIGVNAMLSDEQLNHLVDAGYKLEEVSDLQRAEPDLVMLAPKTFTSYIFSHT